ncbi:MAG TPA: tRNA 2-thiouridine(34) synthase MnmA [Thermoleophilaceae bacterium]|nr:tRNA 2-thiouridine(34) synthase MnmA [Thermoleophilaceae bacterium]
MAPNPVHPHSGAAGGSPCGDLVRVSLDARGGRVGDVDCELEGCGALHAAGAGLAGLAEGAPLLEAARITTADVAAAAGGLTPAGRHAAELAADALHRALGAALRDGAGDLDPVTGRVAVALSGGVDSAVAAHLLREEGHDVVALTLELWADPATDGERSCCSPSAVLGARSLAHTMGLPHFTLDLRHAFRAGVVDPFIDAHAAGLTPNPCVRCNGEVRFDALLDAAERLGAGTLATGHYARVREDGEGPLLCAAESGDKDQSYMLARLPTERLARLRFPLGRLSKPRVRELARSASLPVAERRESQDLCFVAGLGSRGFLRRHGGPRLAERRGDVVDRSGRRLGGHDGQHLFTVGQRRGLGVAGPEPLFVLAKDAVRNRVVVGPRDELDATRVAVERARLHRRGRRVSAVKLRYRSRAMACRVDGDPAAGEHEALELSLERPVEAVAPGQAAVLLDGDLVVGEATIARAG